MNPIIPPINTTADEYALRSLIFRKAESIGPSVKHVVETLWVRAVMNGAYEIEQLFKLAVIHSPPRLESASRRALFYGHSSYDIIDSILMKQLDGLALSRYADIDGQPLYRDPCS